MRFLYKVLMENNVAKVTAPFAECIADFQAVTIANYPA
jgi:hypothetical protein